MLATLPRLESSSISPRRNSLIACPINLISAVVPSNRRPSASSESGYCLLCVAETLRLGLFLPLVFTPKNSTSYRPSSVALLVAAVRPAFLRNRPVAEPCETRVIRSREPMTPDDSPPSRSARFGPQLIFGDCLSLTFARLPYFFGGGGGDGDTCRSGDGGGGDVGLWPAFLSSMTD
jgi:hypothetical protein